MRLLLIHISDIHLRSTIDPVLLRVESICAAIRSLEEAPTGCVIALTGDVAFAGLAEQYDAAAGLLGGLAALISDGLHGHPKVEIAVIPGNHDCDFAGPKQAREILIDALSSKPASQADADVISVLTSVQAAYFEFRDVVQNSEPTGDRLFYSYAFAFGDDKIVVNCCNTAWTSRLHEKPGTMFYPASALGAGQSADLVVTLLHHPYNWQTPDSGRALRKCIEQTSDIVLSGHEHDFTLRSQRGELGEENLYVEGAALQTTGADIGSGFNVIVVDTASKRQRVFHFAWNGERYTPKDPSPTWREYHVARLRSAESFVPSTDTEMWLSDIGLDVAHPAHGQLRLPDVFVYPDFRELGAKIKEVAHVIRGETVVADIGKLDRLLISGPDKSGKTTFAKQVFGLSRRAGMVPVYLDAAARPIGAGEGLHNAIYRAFARQFEGHQLDAYKQLDRTRRVLVIDNIHRLELSKSAMRELVTGACRFAGQVVLLSNDFAQDVIELLESGPLTGDQSFRHLRITQFGYVRRNELAEKWFALDAAVADDGEQLARKLVEVERTLDTIIGKNCVPSYPVFILPLLQAQQYGEAVDLNASSYGYFYELLVRRALAQGSTKEAFDVKIGYLSNLAYHMFQAGLDELTERELRDIHGRYEEKFAIELQFQHMVAELLRCQVLQIRDDRYSFKYRYIFYYFLASHFRDHIDEAKSRSEINSLVEKLHEDDPANILLFLAHLTKHPLVVEAMINKADTQFVGLELASLRPEESPVVQLKEDIEEAVYQEREITESRRDVMQSMDEAKAVTERTEISDEVRAQLVRLGAAFKTLQILGQLLKNFPGSIEREGKLEIVRSCYNLGLRTLSWVFGIVQEDKEELLRSIVENIKRDDPEVTDDELARRASESLFALTFLVSYGLVRRIAFAVGSRPLMKIYDDVRGEYGTPVVELISVALELDQLPAFPKKRVEALAEVFEDNKLSHRVLSGLVISHFHLFDVKFDTKQSICATLGISYKRLQATDPRVKMLPTTTD